MIKKLDPDQQHNADALEAIGVEYPIEKRYIVTESQLAAIGEALSDAQGFYEMFQGWDGVEEREANLEKVNWPTELAGGCEHWHRTCKICGVWPVLEGWLSGDEYYCDPCGNACTTEWYTDSDGVEHVGLTMSQCYNVIVKDVGDDRNDFFFYTNWPVEDDDCSQDAPCYCQCWLCTKYKAAKGS